MRIDDGSISVGPWPARARSAAQVNAAAIASGIGAVDRDAGDAVAGRLVGEHAHGRLLGHRRRQRRLVVLDAEDRRQLARGAQVDRLVPLAERRAAFADERHARRARTLARRTPSPCRRSSARRSPAARRRAGCPTPKSPMCRSLPSIGGPALPICALSTMRTASASWRIASVDAEVADHRRRRRRRSSRRRRRDTRRRAAGGWPPRRSPPGRASGSPCPETPCRPTAPRRR